MSGRPLRMAADEELAAYAARHTTPLSDELVATAASTRTWSRSAEMMVGETVGQLLRLLVAVSGARRVLEVGTFTGYSALAMAGALPPDGQIDTLEGLTGPYDLAFIDADKSAYPEYFERVLQLMRAGGLMVADNVLRGGRVLDSESRDPSVTGMRAFNDMAATDPRVETVMLTVRDGVSLIRVRG